MLAVALAAVACSAALQLSPEPRYASCEAGLCTLTGLLKMMFHIEVSTPITSQFWSLPYEAIFYILCPLLLWRVAAIPLIYLATAILSVVGIAIYGFEINPAPSVLVNFVINAAFWFMSGVMAFHFLDRLPKLKPQTFWAAAATLFIMILGIKLSLGGSNAISNLLMIVLTMLCLTSLPRYITERQVLNWGFFIYSIYIFHVAFLVLISIALEAVFGIRGSDIAHYWAWILVLPPVLLGSWIFYLISERPTNALLRQMKRKQIKDSKNTSRDTTPATGTKS
jgi:peptidoglycan/LPS O-acetylase OafA/YrhL